MSSKAVELEAKLIEKFVGKREEILSRAEMRAQEIIEEARERARRILNEAREAQMRITGTDLRAIKDKALGEAEQEGRRRLMEERERLISRVFETTEERLRAIAEGKEEHVDYQEMLLKLILEAASAIGEEELVIAANERDGEFLRQELRKVEETVSKALGHKVQLTVEEKPIECIGGVIVYDPPKRKIYYNTLEGRLLKVRSRMKAEVAKILGVT